MRRAGEASFNAFALPDHLLRQRLFLRAKNWNFGHLEFGQLDIALDWVIPPAGRDGGSSECQ